MKNQLHIAVPGALLRPWQQGDAPSLARYANNPRVSVCMRDLFPSPYTIDDAHRFIAMATGAAPGLLLAIEIQGEAAGGIGIHPLDDVHRGTAEIGYWLAEPFWGMGIVTGAVRALVPVAFEQTDIVRIQAGIFSRNPASMRVLEKCGFIREAVHRHAITKRGVVMDEVMYVRFRNETGDKPENLCRRSPIFPVHDKPGTVARPPVRHGRLFPDKNAGEIASYPKKNNSY